MNRYRVQMARWYEVEVEAGDEIEAMRKADTIPLEKWEYLNDDQSAEKLEEEYLE